MLKQYALEFYEIKKVNIPFTFSYSHHLAKRSFTDSVILSLIDEHGRISYGECTPREYVTGETVNSVIADLKPFLKISLQIFDGKFESVEASLNHIPENRNAMRCLIESALISSLCQNKNIFKLFDINEERKLIYTAPLSTGSVAKSEEFLKMYSLLKMKRVKLKVSEHLDDNIERIKLTKKYLGDDVDIRMDGNEIWNFEESKKQLPAILDLGVNCFEQLYPKNDRDSCKKAFKEWGNRCSFIVDESMTTLTDLENLTHSDYIQGANLKISKNGGLLQTLKFAKSLDAAGKSVRLGCHVGESSYLSLLGIVFNCIFTKSKDVEGCYGDYLLKWDLFQPSLKFKIGGDFIVDKKFMKNFSLKIKDMS